MGSGRVDSNDVVLLHRLAMSRINSLLGVCGLLRGMYQTDEDYESIGEVIAHLTKVRAALDEICVYDAPIKAEGIY